MTEAERDKAIKRYLEDGVFFEALCALIDAEQAERWSPVGKCRPDLIDGIGEMIRADGATNALTRLKTHLTSLHEQAIKESSQVL